MGGSGEARSRTVRGRGALAFALWALPAAHGLAQEAGAEATPAGGTDLQAIPVGVAEPDVVPPDAVRLETIEVTAGKRVQAQRDIPGSVAAIRGEELEAAAAQGMSDYLKRIPGVTLIDFDGDRSIPIIRGIAADTEFGLTGLTTGIFIDETPFTDLFRPASVPDLHPFDLERVEVLKGPQGTLFGSGALAGAVRYIVQKPQHGAWQGKVLTTASRTGSGDRNATAAAALNVPLFGDAAALRGVGLYREDGGFYDTRSAGRIEDNYNRLRQTAGRVLGSWRPLDSVRVSASHFVQANDQADAVSYADQRERLGRDDIPFPSPFESGLGGTHFDAAWDLTRSTLYYSANRIDKDAWLVAHAERGFSLANQNETEVYSAAASEIRGTTHEVRWSSPGDGGSRSWRWLVGGSMLDYGSHAFQYSPEPMPAGSRTPPRSDTEVSADERQSALLFAVLDLDATENALFGEFTAPIGSCWDVTAGARAFRTELNGVTHFSGAQTAALFQEPEHVDYHQLTEDGFNPRFAVRYLHDRNLQLYALASKGFQFGGVQLNPAHPAFVQGSTQAGFTFGPYKSSSLWNYEFGVRTEWLDRRLRVDAGVFYLDWKELQLTVNVPLSPAGPSPVIDVIVNVGAAHSEGAELAIDVIPVAGARFSSSAAWISARTAEVFDADSPDGPVAAGTRLPGTPRFQWVNVASYEQALPGVSRWTGALEIAHTHLGSAPDHIRRETDILGYDTLDARLRLLQQGSRLMPELTLGVNNLTDVRGIAAHTSVRIGNSYSFIRPRTALLTLGWRF